MARRRRLVEHRLSAAAARRAQLRRYPPVTTVVSRGGRAALIRQIPSRSRSAHAHSTARQSARSVKSPCVISHHAQCVRCESRSDPVVGRLAPVTPLDDPPSQCTLHVTQTPDSAGPQRIRLAQGEYDSGLRVRECGQLPSLENRGGDVEEGRVRRVRIPGIRSATVDDPTSGKHRRRHGPRGWRRGRPRRRRGRRARW